MTPFEVCQCWTKKHLSASSIYDEYSRGRTRTLERDVSSSDENSDDCKNRRSKSKGQGYDIAGGDWTRKDKSCDQAEGFFNTKLTHFVTINQEASQSVLKTKSATNTGLQTWTCSQEGEIKRGRSWRKEVSLLYGRLWDSDLEIITVLRASNGKARKTVQQVSLRLRKASVVRSLALLIRRQPVVQPASNVCAINPSQTRRA